MPQLELIWAEEAIQSFTDLLERRNNKKAVQACVEGHLLAVAANPAIARSDPGPRDLLLYRFVCRDNGTTLNLQAEFAPIDSERIGVVSVSSIAL
jgi:hypothetical protein